MSARVKMTGGKKLKRFLANAKRTARGPAPVIVAGFTDPHIASLAARLEFGDPRANLPERPAFRQSSDDALAAGRAVLVKALKRQARAGDFAIDNAVAEEAADAMAEELRFGYARYSGPGLSERQRKRKVGTPGAGHELVGHEGPRLINRIRGRVTRG